MYEDEGRQTEGEMRREVRRGRDMARKREQDGDIYSGLSHVADPIGLTMMTCRVLFMV